MSKSVEQRLYEAWRSGSGVRLTSFDVTDLMHRDDAMRTRISNAACQEAMVEEEGFELMGPAFKSAPTWRRFVESLK